MKSAGRYGTYLPRLAMSLTAPQNLLINALKALLPNSIYAGVERKKLFGGFRLYSDSRVERITWDGASGALSVRVMDREAVSVLISFEGSRIVPRCTCKDHLEGGRCAHIVCALLTILHLLKPNLFRITTENPERRDRLLSSLLMSPGRRSATRTETGAGRTPAFEVVIEGTRGRLKAYVERDGTRIEAQVDDSSLPPELEYLVNFSRREDMSVPLFIFLRKWAADYAIRLREGKSTHRIEWSGNIGCATWTEFDIAGHEVLVRKGCAPEGDTEPGSLLGNFAFNASRTKMCYVGKRDGWELWYGLRDACVREPLAARSVQDEEDSALRIPREVFSRFQLSFKEAGDGDEIPLAVFKVGGVETKPVVSEADAYGISISRRHGNGREFIIKAECSARGYALSPSHRFISLVKTVEWGHVPLTIRTRKRKPLFYGMYFDALAMKKGRKVLDEALKTAINETTFGAPKYASLARRLIREAVAESRVDEMRLYLHDDGWHLMKTDREKELLLYSIPYRVFGPRIFERVILRDSEMVVDEEELLGRLHALNSLAAKEDIEVRIDGHPIESAAWEFELDATGGTIDWFEIRPEIRCNGQTIERALWEEALKRKGVFFRDGALQVLDQGIMETLSAIYRLTEGPGAKGRTRNEIVTIPRLRIIELISLRKRGIAVRLSPEDEETMARLTQFEKIGKRPPPVGLKAELRPYQQEGYQWLAFLYEHRFGACLADDMGLGKTIQAIALLGAIKEKKAGCAASAPLPSLIVMPPSLVFNWEQEIERFYPDLKVYVYRGKDRSTAFEGYDVVLTSYGLVRRDIGKLKEIPFHVVIFDEAQAIKNIFAGTTGAVRQLRGLSKIALTGTPVENHIGEYFSIMDLVLPGLLGDYREFQGQARQDLSSFISEVTERTRPFLLRRTKERILTELPPKVERDVYLDLTERQKRYYNRTVEEVRSTIDQAYRSKAAAQARIIALTAIMKLRQICLTPQLLVPAQIEVTPKMAFLRDKLEELCAESHSSLVFSQFTSFLDIVEEELRTRQFRIFRLDGSTPVIKRKEIVEGFQNCETPAVFLLSLKAGGQGLNLTRASYVFHLDPWWNPAVENQASDRSHRIGQKNKVIVTRLLMRHTVEEKMMALKQRKLTLYRALMDAPEKSAGKSITREDFNFLLGSV